TGAGTATVAAATAATTGDLGTHAAHAARSRVCGALERYRHPALARPRGRSGLLPLCAFHRNAFATNCQWLCAVRSQYHWRDKLRLCAPCGHCRGTKAPGSRGAETEPATFADERTRTTVIAAFCGDQAPLASMSYAVNLNTHPSVQPYW